jgi:hypothetical protein
MHRKLRRFPWPALSANLKVIQARNPRKGDKVSVAVALASGESIGDPRCSSLR